jgi:hypothetical protein
VATVVVTATAERNLRELIESRSLPASTEQRVRSSMEPLRRFPLLGPPLSGRWTGFRYLLGPWRWLLVVYRYDDGLDRVEIITIQDAREARSPTNSP